MHYLYLSVAILAEVIATTSLKGAQEFTRLIPSVCVVIGYMVSFYCLMLSLRAIPLGVAYAIWSGVGIVLVALLGLYIYRQVLDVAAISGIILIIMGVVVIQLFSKVSVH